MAPPIERVLQLGFRFEPKPVDAVTYYLPRLIAGVPMHATVRSFIHSTDIYAWEPAVLAATTARRPRQGIASSSQPSRGSRATPARACAPPAQGIGTRRATPRTF
jgi:hypothetical protein